MKTMVKLRNLGQNLEEAMMTISKYFKEEEDLLFLAGQKKGAYKKAVEMARQMLADKFPHDQIAKYTRLSLEEIQAL